jgi:hypothetical protein
MSSLRDASGNVLNKTQLLALMTAQTAQTVYTANANVDQRFTYDGGAFEDGDRSLFYAGQTGITQAFIDGLFLTATADAIAPATGLAAGGTNVVITGTNLAGSAGVTFGGVAATNFVVTSNTTITCTAPAHAAGAVSVVVKDDAGDITKAAFYTYT